MRRLASLRSWMPGDEGDYRPFKRRRVPTLGRTVGPQARLPEGRQAAPPWLAARRVPAPSGTATASRLACPAGVQERPEDGDHHRRRAQDHPGQGH
jgi:hypothetical protein